MAAKKAPRGKCVLCSIKPATTWEHVPPESFFEKPRPGPLIQVPACQPCNHGSHLDDEYLLAYLATRDVAGTTPTFERVRERVSRGLNRERFTRLRDRLMHTAEFRVQTDPATGREELIVLTRPESDRLGRTIRKQVRGLVYHLTGRKLPRSRFMMVERVWGAPIEQPGIWDMFTKASAYALGGTVGAVGDVFGYAYREVRRSACSAVVRLKYYGALAYVALIFRPDFGPPQRIATPF